MSGSIPSERNNVLQAQKIITSPHRSAWQTALGEKVLGEHWLEEETVEQMQERGPNRAEMHAVVTTAIGTCADNRTMGQLTFPSTEIPTTTQGSQAHVPSLRSQ